MNLRVWIQLWVVSSQVSCHMPQVWTVPTSINKNCNSVNIPCNSCKIYVRYIDGRCRYQKNCLSLVFKTELKGMGSILSRIANSLILLASPFPRINTGVISWNALGSMNTRKRSTHSSLIFINRLLNDCGEKAMLFFSCRTSMMTLFFRRASIASSFKIATSRCFNHFFTCPVVFWVEISLRGRINGCFVNHSSQLKFHDNWSKFHYSNLTVV